MNQGRRKDQEEHSLLFLGRCIFALFALITLGMVCHDGSMFPWVNMGGVVGLGITVMLAGKLIK